MAKFAKKRTETEIKNTKPAEKVNDIRCNRLDNRYEKQWLKTPNAKRYTPLYQQFIGLCWSHDVTC